MVELKQYLLDKLAHQIIQFIKIKTVTYIARHKGMNEDWSSEGYETAGFYSRWTLWNLPSLRASVADTNKRFGKINIKLRV